MTSSMTPNPHREAGHTPGPWAVEDTRGRRNNLLRVVSGRIGVARINATLHADANARLIAKAPELLAQLDLIISEYLDGGVLNSSIEEAQDLLAQVRGESA